MYATAEQLADSVASLVRIPSINPLHAGPVAEAAGPIGERALAEHLADRFEGLGASEVVLDEVPGIVESAVVGLPHPDFGEAVVPFVVGQVSADELDRACLEHLARFKHPKHYYFVDELPRNAMGKVQKAQLRADNSGFFSPNEG